MTTSLLSRAGLAAVLLLSAAAPAAAFTYDTHIDHSGGANFRDTDSGNGGDAGSFHFNISGGGGGGAAPGSSPFLQSSNPAFSSPVVPWGDGAGSMAPRFLYNNR